MEAKEKAKELIERFSKQQINESSFENFQVAKQCALIAVDEILNDPYVMNKDLSEDIRNGYWQEVKQEIMSY